MPTTPDPLATPPEEATGLTPIAQNAGFVKLAMRNMVRKGRQSFLHFGLTAIGLMAFLLMLAWLGRPRVPL